MCMQINSLIIMNEIWMTNKAFWNVHEMIPVNGNLSVSIPLQLNVNFQ